MEPPTRGSTSTFRSTPRCASPASSSISPARRSAEAIISTTRLPKRRRRSCRPSPACTTCRPADVARAESLLQPLLALHERVRDAVVDACTRRSTEHLATVAVDGAQDGDTIYAVDRVAEETLAQGLADLARDDPLCVVGEGLGDTLGGDGRWRLVVDPIDGTRGLMYQKRSAWILTGIAPNRGNETNLADIEFAIQTEIPLVKQHRSDTIWAFRGKGVNAERYDRVRDETIPLTPKPSTASTIEQGFAMISRFFPGARDVLAEIDEEIVRE